MGVPRNVPTGPFQMGHVSLGTPRSASPGKRSTSAGTVGYAPTMNRRVPIDPSNAFPVVATLAVLDAWQREPTDSRWTRYEKRSARWFEPQAPMEPTW
jgi:hypothetical protein